MRRGWIGIVAALAACAGPAAAADTPPDSWVAQPATADWYAVWPEAARRAGVGGRVILRCKVQDDGALGGCQVVREWPGGQGFAAAMLSLAPKYRRKPPGPNDPREILVPGNWFEFDEPADWRRRPSPEDLFAVAPKEAARRGIGGRATINCIVTVQGTLIDCEPLSESPEGVGFGGAAVALAPQLLMKPARHKGAPVISMVNIPVTWPRVAMARGQDLGRRLVPPNILWTEAPSFAEVAALYPKKAREAGVGGHATVACNLTEEGRLTSCDVANSEPSGYGFDAAARAVARSFRIQVNTPEERKTTRDLAVHLPVTFDPAMLTPGAPVVGKPSWAALPKAEQVAAAFKDVKAPGTSRAVLTCSVQPGGYVSDCKVASESPLGAGVGAAALSLAPSFRLTTWTTDGLPVIGGNVTIPIRYEGGEAVKPAS